MTDYPGEQFPPAVDPDVEPGENTEPDYDSEPGREAAPDYETERGREAEPDYDTEPGTSQYEQSDQYEQSEPGHADRGSTQDDGTQYEESAQYDGADAVEEQGHPLVEETMGRLAELRDRPVGEHAEVYADLHERLQTALVEADADSGDRG